MLDDPTGNLAICGQNRIGRRQEKNSIEPHFIGLLDLTLENLFCNIKGKGGLLTDCLSERLTDTSKT